MLKFGSHDGSASTTPYDVLRASSGVRSVLPITFWIASTLTLRNGSRKFGSVVVTGAANSSERLGARASRDVVARRRSPSSGVSQVPPTFHTSIVPEVL